MSEACAAMSTVRPLVVLLDDKATVMRWPTFPGAEVCDVDAAPDGEEFARAERQLGLTA